MGFGTRFTTEEGPTLYDEEGDVPSDELLDLLRNRVALRLNEYPDIFEHWIIGSDRLELLEKGVRGSYRAVIPHLILIAKEASNLNIFLSQWTNAFIDDYDGAGAIKIDDEGNLYSFYMGIGNITEEVGRLTYFSPEEVLERGVDNIRSEIISTPLLSKKY